MPLVQLEYMVGVILLFNISRHETKFLQAGAHTPGALPGSTAYETALFQLHAYYVFSSVSLSSWHLVASASFFQRYCMAHGYLCQSLCLLKCLKTSPKFHCHVNYFLPFPLLFTNLAYVFLVELFLFFCCLPHSKMLTEPKV